MTNTSKKIACNFFICLMLIFTTAAVYWQVTDYDFLNYDDDQYVTANQHIQNGITWEAIKWLMTAEVSGNWHPVTIFSHMLDFRLYGLNSGMHHLTNLFFHIINGCLLFFTLQFMSGKSWQSAFVAFLFALHPLHVESVAWIAERKDVLSAFFFFLTLLAYFRYINKPTLFRYLPMLFFLILGLMAKPMLVTLPFLLLLLDFWPLNRLNLIDSESAMQPPKFRERDLRYRSHSFLNRYDTHIRNNFNLIVEKIPLFIIITTSSIITLHYQQQGGAVNTLIQLPFSTRVWNALISYVTYITKMFWPFDLAVLYPHHTNLPGWKVLCAFLFLVGITFWALKTVKSTPWFFTGWFWYLGTLVPVIGFIQVGSQSMADRYTYIPLIGLFIIIAWFIPKIIGAWHRKETFLSISAIGCLLIMISLTWEQTHHWSNSITLFKHAIESNVITPIAYNNLGLAYKEKGNLEEAFTYLSKALRLSPDFSLAHNNIGMLLSEKGRKNEAKSNYYKAIQFEPDFAEAHNNLGVLLSHEGQPAEAQKHFLIALEKMPYRTEFKRNLETLVLNQKKIKKAIEGLKKKLEIEPNNPMLYYQLGNMFRKLGDLDRALIQYQKALSIQPDFHPAIKTLSEIGNRQ